jgi:hypothetical protein
MLIILIKFSHVIHVSCAIIFRIISLDIFNDVSFFIASARDMYPVAKISVVIISAVVIVLIVLCMAMGSYGRLFIPGEGPADGVMFASDNL